MFGIPIELTAIFLHIIYVGSILSIKVHLFADTPPLRGIVADVRKDQLDCDICTLSLQAVFDAASEDYVCLETLLCKFRTYRLGVVSYSIYLEHYN